MELTIDVPGWGPLKMALGEGKIFHHENLGVVLTFLGENYIELRTSFNGLGTVPLISDDVKVVDPQTIKEMVVGLSTEESQELFNFMYDAMNCRRYK